MYGWNNICYFGLYERGTHTVFPIPYCSVHHILINLTVEALTKATADMQTIPYSEDTSNKGLRYVQLQVKKDMWGILLSLIWNSDTVKGCQPQLSRLVKSLRG